MSDPKVDAGIAAVSTAPEHAGARDEEDDVEMVDGGAAQLSSRNPTPYSSTADRKPRRLQEQQQQHEQEQQQGPKTNAAPSSVLPQYGAPIEATTSGNFPAVGSTLGPYFSVGRLGKGTFCSIHKCINLHYYHRRRRRGGNGYDDGDDRRNIIPATAARNPRRLAAAKVEIGEFKNSGVLGGEAAILHFLDSVLPSHTVPVYMGHYRSESNISSSSSSKRNSTTSSAIVMEYLSGQDMHVVRDWAARKRAATGGSRPRRLAVQDAVYLTAGVMLPLLKRMHDVGIVHRDVKPSNVVKRGDTAHKDFCMVDFGLSKSIVVPGDSGFADGQHVWTGHDWMRPSPVNEGGNLGGGSGDGDGRACYRKERPSADFRGTSMYASVRVHQLRDYSPRDDVWSLLYVFCDLASGGLPWMSHAANRDRQACQRLKERIHGLEAQADGEILVDTRRLLMGDEYHVALFRKYRGGIDPPPGSVDDQDDPTLPPPLALSKDTERVGLLTTAFEHLKGLQFADKPDYELIGKCLEGFLEGSTGSSDGTNDDKGGGSARDGAETESVPPIDWEQMSNSFRSANNEAGTTAEPKFLDYDVPTWDLLDGNETDPVDSAMLALAEKGDIGGAEEDSAPLVGEAADAARLPLELRFRVSQMDYNTLNCSSIEPHFALRDWMKVALFLLHGHWDAKKYEKGGHRTDDDGYRREHYLKLVDKCLDCAANFRGFHQKECFYENDSSTGTDVSRACSGGPALKKRKIGSNIRAPKVGSKGVDMLGVAKAMFQLRRARKVEEKLPRAPPPRLSFG